MPLLTTRQGAPPYFVEGSGPGPDFDRYGNTSTEETDQKLTFNAGAIVGLVAGLIAMITLITALCCLCRRRQLRKRELKRLRLLYGGGNHDATRDSYYYMSETEAPMPMKLQTAGTAHQGRASVVSVGPRGQLIFSHTVGYGLASSENLGHGGLVSPQTVGAIPPPSYEEASAAASPTQLTHSATSPISPAHVATHCQSTSHHGRYHSEVSDISDVEEETEFTHPTITDGDSRAGGSGNNAGAGFKS
ncbi:hypothetical protein B0H66DRAFT_608547 [Apodospora peruviana]|uniref:Uncharacterized protein n=1 Tax=Apodospora peruviana TaxID=516989 RepID=A0AAE0HSW4_9PEZI|nr:hypothetical protein B0H66DRAFT_608547 [Apodospora peruviana]